MLPREFMARGRTEYLLMDVMVLQEYCRAALQRSGSQRAAI